MGYYTNYRLEILDKENKLLLEIKDERDIDKAIKGFIDKQDIQQDLAQLLSKIKENDNYYGITSEEDTKWYEWEGVMKTLSKEYPNYIFCLNGVGEENGDMWKAYFHNGSSKVLRAEFRFPDFDPLTMVR